MRAPRGDLITEGVQDNWIHEGRNWAPGERELEHWEGMDGLGEDNKVDDSFKRKASREGERLLERHHVRFRTLKEGHKERG